MASTKNKKNEKEQNKKQSLMTQPTLEEKNKIKEVGQLSQATLKMILQIIHEFKAKVLNMSRIQNMTRESGTPREKNVQRRRIKNKKPIYKHIRICSTESNFMEQLPWTVSIRY